MYPSSGSCDGEVRVWSLSSQDCLATIQAHSGFVRGLCTDRQARSIITVGEDKVVKTWRYPDNLSDINSKFSPVTSTIGKSVFLGVDHHWTKSIFGTCGEKVDIWDSDRSEPVRSFTWGVDSITNIKFNPIECNVLATTGSDRTIALYDIRGSTPLRKVILSMKSNGISWNPIEAYHFTVANEDSNLYTFDMRKLDQPLNVHMDHVMAVLDVDYSPTGQEFVSGSFDKTVRIFRREDGRSRDVYHTKRMQRIFCVQWSADSAYILTGSDETNIRLWRSQASHKAGKLRPRERAALQYADKLRHR